MCIRDRNIFFNRLNTGAGSDIKHVSRIARSMVCEWGMSEKLGPLTYGSHEESVFLGRDYGNRQQDYSEQTAEEIDREVRRIVQEQYDRANAILIEKKDILEAIAKAHDSTAARVALAWVQGRPGVGSTIIGARTMAQLEDNIKGLDVVLTSDERARLDALTTPTFGFPQSMQPIFPAIHNGGTTVNGVYMEASGFVMEPGGKPY